MPVQCPECARFLSNAFVAKLQKGPAPCPKCETALHAEQFAEHDGDATVEPGTPLGDRDGSADNGDAESVRPPDLPPTEVRDETPDVLADWDRPDNIVSISSSRRHELDPTATGAAIGAGVALGVIVGGLVNDRTVRGALVGGALGAGAGAAAARAMARRHELDLIE